MSNVWGIARRVTTYIRGPVNHKAEPLSNNRLSLDVSRRYIVRK